MGHSGLKEGNVCLWISLMENKAHKRKLLGQAQRNYKEIVGFAQRNSPFFIIILFYGSRCYITSSFLCFPFTLFGKDPLVLDAPVDFFFTTQFENLLIPDTMGHQFIFLLVGAQSREVPQTKCKQGDLLQWLLILYFYLNQR